MSNPGLRDNDTLSLQVIGTEVISLRLAKSSQLDLAVSATVIDQMAEQLLNAATQGDPDYEKITLILIRIAAQTVRMITDVPHLG